MKNHGQKLHLKKAKITPLKSPGKKGGKEASLDLSLSMSEP